MKLPTIQGTIRRRILANFRVEPQAMQRQLPSRFMPKRYDGFAVAGICMIRLDHIRPKLMPEIVGISSENAEILEVGVSGLREERLRALLSTT